MPKKDIPIWPFILAGAAIGVAAMGTETGQRFVNPGALLPIDFIREYFKFAKQTQQTYNVPLQVTLAQAAVESGYGKHAPGNNFFGIKAGSSWKGETQLLKTWECGATGDAVKDGIKDQVIAVYPPGDPNGVCSGKYSYRVYGKFRKYPTPADSFNDHAKFFIDNKRYAAAFKYSNDPKQFATEIAKAGYATAPNYATALHTLIDNINSIASQNNLT